MLKLSPVKHTQDCIKYLLTSTDFETSQHHMQEVMGTGSKRGLCTFMKYKTISHDGGLVELPCPEAVYLEIPLAEARTQGKLLLLFSFQASQKHWGGHCWKRMIN